MINIYSISDVVLYVCLIYISDGGGDNVDDDNYDTS